MSKVFFDIDTQIDFLFPSGALYVPGAEKLIPTVAALNGYAASHGIPLVSTVCAHPENDPEFQVWPPHCVLGTVGQHKPTALVVGGTQIIFEKQRIQFFDDSRLAELLAGFSEPEYFVYGVVTELCVADALRGLLQTGRPVTLVTDAAQALNAATADATLAEFQAAGGHLAHAADLLVQ